MWRHCANQLLIVLSCLAFSIDSYGQQPAPQKPTLKLGRPDAVLEKVERERVGEAHELNADAVENSLTIKNGDKLVMIRNEGGNMIFGTAGGTASLPAGGHLGNVPFGSMWRNWVEITEAGNVAIGGRTAAHRLTIEGGPPWTDWAWGGAIELENAAAIAWRANSSHYRFGIGHTNDGFFFFRTTSDPANRDHAPINDLIIRNDGTVSVNVLEITGADLAENFAVTTASAGESGGMVVSIDPGNPGKLMISDREYDTRVAGVISGAGGIGPGAILGARMAIEDGQPVALTGRVYCWTDTSGGPVNPGDLLTTSSRAGHARKVTDHAKAQGAILGKAMASLEEGTGLILVLVTLQ